MGRNWAHNFDNSEDCLLILNELNGEKQAKRPKFFLNLFFAVSQGEFFGWPGSPAPVVFGWWQVVDEGTVLDATKDSPFHLQG